MSVDLSLFLNFLFKARISFEPDNNKLKLNTLFFEKNLSF